MPVSSKKQLTHKTTKVTRIKNQRRISHRLTKTQIIFVIIIVAILIVAGTIVFNRVIDEQKVGSIQEHIRQLTINLKNQNPQYSFRNISYCSNNGPRYFGDDTTYSCTVAYETLSQVQSIEDINTNVSRLYLSMSEYKQDISQLSRPRLLVADLTPLNEAITSLTSPEFSFKLVDVSSARCSVSFRMNKQSQLVSRIICTTSTLKTYYTPVIDE